MRREYEPIRPYITTSNGPNGAVIDFHFNYERSGQRWESRKEAINEGLKVYGSDDFNIAVWMGDRLESWDWMDHPVGEDSESLAELNRKLA